MWSADRLARALVIGLLLLTAGCGFRPLYGEDAGGTAVQGLSETRVERIPDREGQLLRTRLELLFGSGSAPARYALNVALSTNIRDVAIRRDETATRRSIIARADYSLIRIEDGSVLNQGTARSTNSYNIAESDFATRVARDDAIERSIEQLALSVQTQLAIFFREGGPEAAGAPEAGARQALPEESRPR